VAKNRKAEVDQAVADLDFEKNTYQVELKTSMGQIVLNLFPDVAPQHCRNLIGLARVGYYDGVIFHRVIKGFVIQGGCPEGTGRGGPGYTVNAEFNKRPHQVGTLSMARTPDPNSAGSQFFLCLGRVTQLDGEYTVFGEAADEESRNVILKIGNVATNNQDRPNQDVVITSATVQVQAK
jgi:peptidyl-prolyl cis-trans isomerase B (cyclophilin B)